MIDSIGFGPSGPMIFKGFILGVLAAIAYHQKRSENSQNGGHQAHKIRSEISSTPSLKRYLSYPLITGFVGNCISLEITI
jgi:hypothetical protein